MACVLKSQQTIFGRRRVYQFLIVFDSAGCPHGRRTGEFLNLKAWLFENSKQSIAVVKIDRDPSTEILFLEIIDVRQDFSND